VQLYVNRYPGELSASVLATFPELARSHPAIRWTAPLEAAGYAEPRDLAFLVAIERGDLWQSLQDFWPKMGPVWDAVAVLDFADGTKGALLAEGKSHPSEVYGGGTGASPASRERIEQALLQTQRWLGVDIPVNRWLDPLRPGEPGHSSVYQSANRYAHLYWLREVAAVDAWLAHLLFIEDPTFKPTTREKWEYALPRIEADLGLVGVHIPCAGHVFLPGVRE
jgi:hypothetical protein